MKLIINIPDRYNEDNNEILNVEDGNGNKIASVIDFNQITGEAPVYY